MNTKYIGVSKIQASVLIKPSELDASCEGYLIEINSNLPPTLKASYKLLKEAQLVATELNSKGV